MNKRRLGVFLAVCLLAIILATYPLDAYITRPGDAYALEPLVEVAGGDQDDEGTFSLMTVSMLNATPALYVWAKFDDAYKVLQPEQVRNPHENEDEYNVRQLKLMSDSQFNAILSAYKEAGKPFEVIREGVFVMNILPSSAADGILEPGDRILSIDGQEYESQETFMDYLQQQEAGTTIELEVERSGRTIQETVELAAIPGGANRVGLGITFVEDKAIETDPDVEIESEEIGGPSAGLMFTLEILNQLVDEDLTKGHNIAGTGTMSENGEVGRIGGIDQKVIAADKAGVEVFFAPDDETEGNESNYATAVETAEQIGTDMQIVPVQKLSDAIEFLDELQPA